MACGYFCEGYPMCRGLVYFLVDLSKKYWDQSKQKSPVVMPYISSHGKWHRKLMANSPSVVPVVNHVRRESLWVRFSQLWEGWNCCVLCTTEKFGCGINVLHMYFIIVYTIASLQSELVAIVEWWHIGLWKVETHRWVSKFRGLSTSWDGEMHQWHRAAVTSSCIFFIIDRRYLDTNLISWASEEAKGAMKSRKRCTVLQQVCAARNSVIREL